MKPSMLALGALVLQIVAAAPNLSPDQAAAGIKALPTVAVDVAAQAKAAYEAAMQTVADSQVADEAADEDIAKPVQMHVLKAKAVKKINATEELLKLQKKEAEERTELEAANEKAEQLEEELTDTKQELLDVRTAKKALHDRNSLAASNAEMMMHDMHSTLSDERDVRIQAEKNASGFAHQLALMTKNRDKLASELELSKSIVKKQVSTNEGTSSELDKAHTDTEAIRTELESLKKENEEKTTKLQYDLEHFQELELEDREELNKTKEEYTEKIEHLKADLSKKLNASESLRLLQKKKAFKLFAKTVKEVKDLKDENTKVKMHFIKHHKLMGKLRDRLTRADNMLKDEHKQGQTAQTDTAEAQKHYLLLKEKFQELKEQLDASQQANEELEEKQKKAEDANDKKGGKLQEIKSKMNKQDADMQEMQLALKQSLKKLDRASTYKENARKRLVTLWSALEAKRAQLKVHDEHLAHVERKLDEAEAYEKKLTEQLAKKQEVESQMVKIDTLDKLKENDLKELHAHFANVEKEKKEFEAAKAKLAIHQDTLQGKLDPDQKAKWQEHVLKDQELYNLAIMPPAAEQAHLQIVNMTNTHLNLAKQQLDDTQAKLAELNAQLAKDEGSLADFNVTDVSNATVKTQLRGSTA